MTTKPVTRFDALLSSRARIGWDAPAPPSRPVLDALYDFGAGYPDPATYPYDGLVEATARMMKEEGGDALNYGEYQGYLGLREVVCHKYTQRSKGFAFVQMTTIEEARRAVQELHDKEFLGRKLVVSGAKTPDMERAA